MENEAILESKIEVLEKKLADCEKELRAQELIRLDLLKANLAVCGEISKILVKDK
jgi:hypothetical protein